MTTLSKCTILNGDCICVAVLTCCGANVAKHHQHSWERYHKTGVGWFCSACDADNPAVIRPGLTGRQARCTCGHLAPSSGDISSNYVDLPFFQHLPQNEYDSWYDGCRGWD